MQATLGAELSPLRLDRLAMRCSSSPAVPQLPNYHDVAHTPSPFSGFSVLSSVNNTTPPPFQLANSYQPSGYRLCPWRGEARGKGTETGRDSGTIRDPNRLGCGSFSACTISKDDRHGLPGEAAGDDTRMISTDASFIWQVPASSCCLETEDCSGVECPTPPLGAYF